MSIDICKELSQNFIDFSYEANSERAFPDVRDGLKPGQRAILWTMYSSGFSSNKPHVKSAKISGQVIAEYWPHGDVAVYDTFTRMSQDWINNIPEVDFHGSNGTIVISGQGASDRYTEARLSKAAEDGMLYSVKKNTVPMILNFSEDKKWPAVLPSVFPRLIVNGSQGIGVTIAQNWFPHNLNEIADAIIKYINTKTVDCYSLYPDFPTGGIIINKNDLHEIYESGKGKIVLRGKVTIDGNTIVITELPYQVYIEPFIAEIKTLIEKDMISGIEEIYNKSDNTGIRVEIVCSKSPNRILKNLYKNTSLQKIFAPNHMALLGKTPRMFTIVDYFDEYIKHNQECIKKEYSYDLDKAKERYNIVEGLTKALTIIDDVIATIKASKSSTDAQQDLISSFGFNEEQAKAIVDMKLGRLAHLELSELSDEKKELEDTMTKCSDILNSEDKLNGVFISRLQDFVKKYGFQRKTEVIQYVAENEEEEEETSVEPEKCVVTMTNSGYIKRIPGDTFKASKKGTKGIKTQDDITNSVIRTNTVDNILVFSDKGKVYKLAVSDIPEGTATSKGMSIKLLTTMDADENASTIYSIYKDTDAEYILFITKDGTLKKSKLEDYLNIRKGKGLAAINLKKNDKVVSAILIKEEQVIIMSKEGKMIWFETKGINPMGRTAGGIHGMRLDKTDEVVSAVAVRDVNDKLGIFTTSGYGKRVDMSEFTIHSHGGKGQLAYKPNKNNGTIAGIQMLSDSDLILIVGDKNSLCVEGKDIPIVRKVSQGSLMIKDSNIVSVSKV